MQQDAPGHPVTLSLTDNWSICTRTFTISEKSSLSIGTCSPTCYDLQHFKYLADSPIIYTKYFKLLKQFIRHDMSSETLRPNAENSRNKTEEWGGLDYQDLTQFDMVLKVTWLGGVLYNNEG